MSWISEMLLGYINVLASAIPLPRRKSLNFVGPGLVAVDNPGQARTDVSLADTILIEGKAIESIAVTAPLTKAGPATTPTLGIAAASGSTAGSMSASHFSLVDSATEAATPSTIVKRDVMGGAAFGGKVAVENLTVTGNLTWFGEFSNDGGIFKTGECKAEKFTLTKDVTEARVLDVAPVSAPGDWTVDTDLLAVNLLPGRPIAWPLRVPFGAQLLDIAAVLAGGAGHAALPATKLKMSLRKVPFFGAVPSQIADAATDASTTVAAYQNPHVLALDFTSGGQNVEVIANTVAERYMVRIDAESGANALAGATVRAIVVTWKRLAGNTIGQD